MWGEPEVWGEIRSPVLAAPSSANYRGLIASTTNQSIGAKVGKLQELPERELNKLCKEHEPLIKSLAARYMGKGIAFEDLVAAGQLGLAKALTKFDPQLGFTIGVFARYWIRGEMTALFKSNDPLALGRAKSLTVLNIDGEEEPEESHQRDVAAPPPIISPDLSALGQTDRYIIESRLRGDTLAEIGKVLGLSAERVRQREVRARSGIKGLISSQCLSDLTRRGKVIRHPEDHARREVDFRDREPPKHTYAEPKPSRRITHHRANACRLADLRGNEPLRNPRGPRGGPVIHGWGAR